MDGQPEPAAHLDQDQREGNGDAEAPVQDVVQKAVPRIVVLLGVPPEPLLLEEELAQAVEAAERIALGSCGFGPRGQAVKAVEVRPDIQVRILRPGDQERRQSQIDLGLGSLNGGGELGKRRVGVNTRTSSSRGRDESPRS